nr:two-component regulator propeller domain-containing protein [Pontibacter sp. 172403-2]
MQYDAGTETLVIAYKNTSIDLLRENEIISINDIYRKAVPGVKAINQIYTYNKLAYLSCSFGVVVLDLQQLEVRETYSNLGLGGEAVNVQATAIRRDSIFLATDKGILAAPLTGVNLQDFHSWRSVSRGLDTPGQVNSLAVFNQDLYAGTNTQGVYVLQELGWQPIPADAAVNSISASDNYLVITYANSVSLLDKAGHTIDLEPEVLKAPQEAIVGTDGQVWVADANEGLVKIDVNLGTATAFAPNGPYANDSFRLYAAKGKVYALSGGYNAHYQPQDSYNGFYVYADGLWQSFNKYTYPNPTDLAPAADIVDAVYNPVTGKLYFASYGSGLLEWSGPGNNKLYSDDNSPLLADETESVRLTDLAVDAEGNVWVVNRSRQPNAPGVYALQPDGTWTSFILPGVADGSNLEYILVDDNGRKWLSTAREQNARTGLVVFDEKENQVRYLSTGEGNGGLPDNAVYSMAKDLNGDIWVGTGKGVGVYYNPAYVFEEQVYDARIPIIDRRPLLDGQAVRSIAVDGANRKWMGTDKGLWLFSPDGDELIYHFTTENSPLPSDKVLSVAVEHRSGEVFVATEAGMASFRSDATTTEGKPECAVVFPNPVRRDYTGLVGISGLPNNADVRITDIAGMLVYKTRATGGTLAWNARDYNGRRVKAGVYLVMSASIDGKQTCISKIAVLE